jgi:murein DD-endopeptidase MepM/ murein hydrolase activator NlpD
MTRPAPCWPVPVYLGRWPTITDSYQADADASHRAHPGVDIMYPRAAGDPPADGEHWSRLYGMPSGVYALACDAGIVVRAVFSAQGWSVTVRHTAGPLAGLWSYYTHMREGIELVKANDAVRAGSRLGMIHHSPAPGYAVAHLHLGVYADAYGRVSKNPATYLRNWRAIEQGTP